MSKLVSRFCIYCATFILVVILCAAVNHALKLSTTTIKVKDGQLIFQTRMFADDLSTGMRLYSKKQFPLDREQITAEQSKVLKKYFLENFSVKINSASTDLQFTNIQTDFSDPDVTVIVVSGEIKGKFKVSDISEISVRNTLLFDYAPEQRNIVNISDVNAVDKILSFNYKEDLGFQDVDY